MPKFEIDNTLANRANENANQQAERILAHLKKQLAADPNKKIGLVYAANNRQAEGMQASLDANIPLPDYLLNGGSGQAPVFMELMRLINKDPACRGKIKIIPVSTSLTGGENKPGNIVNNDMIKRDMKSLQRKLQAGYDIFAMPSGQIAGYFAIGGKASAHWFTTTHAAFQYKGQLYSQGDFVQILINALKQNPALNLDAVFSEAKLLNAKDIAKANIPVFDNSPGKAAQPNAQNKQPQPPQGKTKALEVDVEMMKFNNNVLRAIADDKKPTEYLTPTQKEWWKVVEECQGSVKIYVSSKHEAQIDLNQFAKLGNPGTGFKDFFDQVPGKPDQIISNTQLAKLKQKGVFAPESYDKGVEDARTQTKYRVIVSDVPVLNADGTISKIKVLSTCAPNLMGSSDADRKEFLDGENLNQAKYREACTEIANLMVFAAKDSNIHPVKIAEFGLGVYLKKLPESQKQAARDIMYSAFREAAEKNKVQIDWLIWNDPHAKKEDINKSVDRLNNVAFKGSDYIKASSGDLIGDVPTWTKEHPNVGEVNNGSDRTIGGDFTYFKPRTTEEQLAQAAFLAVVQTNLNSKLTNDVKVVNTDTQQFTQKGNMAQQPAVAAPKPVEVKPPQAAAPRPVEVKPPQAAAPRPVEVKPPQAAAPKPVEVKPPQAAAPGPIQPPVQATSHQKMHGLMNVVAQQKSLVIKAKLAQNFGLIPVQMALITAKDGSMTMKVRFSDQASGQQFSNQLALMGITSNSMPGELKKVRDLVVFLTEKDLGFLNTLQKDLATIMRETATSCLNVSSDKVTTSKNKHDINQTNVIMTFASKNEAELMGKSLSKMGVISNSIPGNPKSITDNKIVLTANDMVVVKQQHQAVMSKVSMLKEDMVNAISIVPSVNKKTGDTNIVMTFASKDEAEQVSKLLFNSGIASLGDSTKPKTVGTNNEIVLSQEQGVQLHQQFTAIKEEKAFLNAHIPINVTIVPSKDAKTGQVNILTVFKSESDAKKFTEFLAERGVRSNSSPGQSKSVQPGNGVILTVGDCEKLEQQLIAFRKPNS